MDELTDVFRNTSISSNNGTGNGQYRLPDTVTDESGDPHNEFYVAPPEPDAVGQRWNVYRGTHPGIYTDWPTAQEYTSGISHASHNSFGTPQEAWQNYEYQRRRNFVQRLPYLPPGAPPLPQLPAIPGVEEAPAPTTPARNPAPATPARNPAPATPARNTARATPACTRERTSHRHTQEPTTRDTTNPQRTFEYTTPSRAREPTPSRGSSHTPSHAPGHTTSRSQHVRSVVVSERNPTYSPTHRRPYPTPLSIPEQPTAGTSNLSASISSPSSLSPTSDYEGIPPWETDSRAFVVFSGIPPGVYTTWAETSDATNVRGAIYRGYAHWEEAVRAYGAAQRGGYLRYL